jgi:carbohydrate kinase (thermoresistant glucokinase family)
MSKSLIIFIMGVSGSGKTTIGKLLSEKIGIPFFDADDFHSQVNKQKMRTGQPLTDEDRKDWLERMNEIAKVELTKNGAIIACSALKEKYRQVLSQGIVAPIFWIFLRGDYDLIARRMKARPDHYMPVSLLTSQFEILEVPENVMAIDSSERPENIVEKIVSYIR